MTVMAE